MWPSDFSFTLRALAARLQQQHGDLFVFDPSALKPLFVELQQMAQQAGLPHAPIELTVDAAGDLVALVYWPEEQDPHWSILVAKDGDIYAGPSGRPWNSEKCSWPERDRMVQDRHRWVLRARQHIITMLAHWQDYLASTPENRQQPASNDQSEDPSTWIGASKVYPERFVSIKHLHRFLKDHGVEASDTTKRERGCVRWRKPSKQRLEVHAGDWLQYWSDQDSKVFDGELADPSQAEALVNHAEAAKEQLRQQKKDARK